MGKVKDILKRKGETILSVTSDTIIFDALRLMSEKNVGALVVIDNGKLSGIFSERDYARKIILKGRTSLDTQVREIMTPDVFTVSPNDGIDHCKCNYNCGQEKIHTFCPHPVKGETNNR